VLLANAQRRDYDHRRTVSRNIVVAAGQARPAAVCAHHIVALKDDEAARSRTLLFRLHRGSDEVGGRQELKDMKGDLLAGRMQLQ
jgi:hypothetical protein